MLVLEPGRKESNAGQGRRIPHLHPPSELGRHARQIPFDHQSSQESDFVLSSKCYEDRQDSVLPSEGSFSQGRSGGDEPGCGHASEVLSGKGEDTRSRPVCNTSKDEINLHQELGVIPRRSQGRSRVCQWKVSSKADHLSCAIGMVLQLSERAGIQDGLSVGPNHGLLMGAIVHLLD